MSSVPPQASKATRQASRFLTSLRLQALEYRHRWLLFIIVLAMPVAFFSATYFTVPAGGELRPVDVPVRDGVIQVLVEVRETFPMMIGIMGVSWGMSIMAFFSVMGNLQRDRRLILCGYKPWQILLARLGLLFAVSIPLALIGTLPYTVISSSLHPELVWLANLLAGLISAGFGLLIGTLLPRPTEGLLVVILVTGIGMSLEGDAKRFFFTYHASQLLTLGRLSTDPWAFPHIWQGLLVAMAFIGLALVLWSWRMRKVRQ
ncbi:MAG: hypothetical protein HYX81_04050 [Chloroflexi bacterium]|nr:hypothetical protein [Chloroflexota bacterium]